MKISSRNLNALPSIEKLIKTSQSIAMLDAIICQEWEYRYYSFNSKWDDNDMMASMRDGEGSHYFILFFEDGAMIKGFDKNAPINKAEDKLSWLNNVNQIPAVYNSFLKEPAFITDMATFFIWKSNCDSHWQTFSFDNKIIDNIEDPCLYSNDFDGSNHLLAILDGSPLSYKKWADEYYERNLDLRLIEKVYEQVSLTKELVESLNPDIDYEILIEDAEEIGYPYDINICS